MGRFYYFTHGDPNVIENIPEVHEITFSMKAFVNPDFKVSPENFFETLIASFRGPITA